MSRHAPEVANKALRAIINKKTIEIRPFNKTGQLNIPGVTAFSCRYSTEKCFLFSALNFSINPGMPYHKSRQQRFFENENPLWWSVLVKKDMDHFKRTLRSWTNRRLRIAFTESLKKKGFNKDGFPLEGREGDNSICGSLQIRPESSTVKKTGMEDLIKQTDRLVERIIQRQSWMGGGSMTKHKKDGKSGFIRKGGKPVNKPPLIRQIKIGQ